LATRKGAGINRVAQQREAAIQRAIDNARERSGAHSMQKNAKVIRQKITGLNMKIKAKNTLLERVRAEGRPAAVLMLHEELEELKGKKIGLRAELKKLTPAVDKGEF